MEVNRLLIFLTQKNMRTFKNPNFYIAVLYLILSTLGFITMYIYGFDIVLLFISIVILSLSIRSVFEHHFAEPSVYDDIRHDIKLLTNKKMT